MSKKHFSKPKRIAVMAALIGVFVHLAAFFAIEVGVSLPAIREPVTHTYVYAGSLDRELSRFRDPLQIYLTPEYDPAYTELQNFRSLSISQEISGFPPRFLLTERMQWSAWVESQDAVMNPATLIHRPEFNPFHFYGRKDSPQQKGSITASMDIRQTDLNNGMVTEFRVELPDWFLDRTPVRVQLQPARFLVDLHAPHTRKQVLQISSSGDDETDQGLIRLINETLPQPRKSSYYEYLFYPLSYGR